MSADGLSAGADTTQDLTDVSYWDHFWDLTPVQIAPSRGRIRDQVREAVIEEISPWVRPRDRWVEIGCASSHLLYDFPNRLGARLDGVDASEGALAATRAALGHHAIEAELSLHDFRELRDDERGAFDGVVSCGFVEHFADCADVHRQLHRYLRPGGTVVTIVPNMAGVSGLLQMAVDEEIYLTHHVLTPPILQESMEAAGFHVELCRPFMAFNLGVVNAGALSPSVRRLTEILLVGSSRLVGVAELLSRRRLGPKLWRSPYLIAVATA